MRFVDWLFLTRTGRASWSAAGAGMVGLTILFQHLGWYG